MVDGVREVKIHGQFIEIRAEVADLTSLSAHADSDQLLQWLRGFETPPLETFIVHGEPSASAALRDRIERELEWSCTIPAMGQRSALTEGELA
jgi:metallo-beta-lactamase family protein